MQFLLIDARTAVPYMTLFRYWLTVLSVFLCASVFDARPARAYLDSNRYSDTEKVMFAFSKLGNVPPDYESLIKNNDYYINSAPIAKLELMKTETVRLQEGFNKFSPEDDLIRIVADVDIRWSKKDFPANWKGAENQVQFSAPDPDSQLAQAKIYQVSFGQAAGSDKTAPFFPFYLGRLWIAVVPKDIGAFLNLSLNTPDYYQFMKKLGAKPYAEKGKALVEMMLRPVSASSERPVEIDQTVYWPMLADIENITLWTADRDHIIWSYDSAGYETKDQKDMRDLYDKNQ